MVSGIVFYECSGDHRDLHVLTPSFPTRRSSDLLRETERFAVNVLQIGQQPTSNRFAGKGEDRFAATPWELGEYGTPVLAGSLSSFECAREAVHGGGDHFILVGRVLKALFEPRRDPLLYLDRKTFLEGKSVSGR